MEMRSSFEKWCLSVTLQETVEGTSSSGRGNNNRAMGLQKWSETETSQKAKGAGTNK